MARPRILNVVYALLLLVARQEVHARNYLWWALGIEETNHGRRQLFHNNWKTRTRISTTRKARRQQRQNGNQVSTRAASGGNEGPEKKGRKNLRAKVAAQLHAEQDSTGIIFVSSDVSSNKQKAVKNDGRGKAKGNEKEREKPNEKIAKKVKKNEGTKAEQDIDVKRKKKKQQTMLDARNRKQAGRRSRRKRKILTKPRVRDKKMSSTRRK